MRYINKADIHAKAVQIGRKSRNGMKRTADRLAACNVDKQITEILATLKSSAWDFEDSVIINACASRLWIDFCHAEVMLQSK